MLFDFIHSCNLTLCHLIGTTFVINIHRFFHNKFISHTNKSSATKLLRYQKSQTLRALTKVMMLIELDWPSPLTSSPFRLNILHCRFISEGILCSETCGIGSIPRHFPFGFIFRFASPETLIDPISCLEIEVV